MKINIRREKIEDYEIVEKITREAFYSKDDLSTKGFACSEHYFVHELRKQDGILELSLVAEKDNEIVGHIIYSHSHVINENKKVINTITFGPVSVRKDLQNNGIGTQLINHSIKLAKSYGYGAIIIFGHPNYYPRFGFVPGKKFNLYTKDNNQFDAFMVKELIPDYLKMSKGVFYESKILDEEGNMKEIIQFDKTFQD